MHVNLVGSTSIQWASRLKLMLDGDEMYVLAAVLKACISSAALMTYSGPIQISGYPLGHIYDSTLQN